MWDENWMKRRPLYLVTELYEEEAAKDSSLHAVENVVSNMCYGINLLVNRSVLYVSNQSKM